MTKIKNVPDAYFGINVQNCIEKDVTPSVAQTDPSTDDYHIQMAVDPSLDGSNTGGRWKITESKVELGPYINLDTGVSEPTGTEGDAWYDSTNHILKYYDGTSWVSVGRVVDHSDLSNLNGDTAYQHFDEDNLEWDGTQWICKQSFYIYNGKSFRVYDSDESHHLEIKHDGSNPIFETEDGEAEIHKQDVDAGQARDGSIPSGGWLKICGNATLNSAAGIGAASGGQVIYIHADADASGGIKLDAYDYNNTTALDIYLGGNGGDIIAGSNANFRDSQPCSFQCRENNDMTISNGAYTQVTGFTEIVDYGGNFNGTSGYFQAPTDGMYHFEAHATLDNTAWAASELFVVAISRQTAASSYSTSYRYPGTYKECQSNNTEYMAGQVTATIYLAENDRVIMEVYQNTGGNVNMLNTASDTMYNYFTGFRVT